jgi:NitT/TauT family transport system substrate-binding protein
MKKEFVIASAVVIFLLFIFWLISIFFGGNNVGNSQLEKINLKLKWIHQAQFAGNYVAIEKGFYRAAGLDVNVEPFSFEDKTIDAVLSGKADFGITGADELIIARAKGLPIKAIAVVYKTNPVCAYSFKKNNILRPEDLIGKKIGIEKGINVEYLYAAMMARMGIDRSKVVEVAIGYDAKELLSGEVDVSTGYIINEPNLVVESGIEVNTILMSDYGADMYADVIFTTEDMIKLRPTIVLNFLRATLDGWQYAIEHEEEAVDITLKYSKDSKIHESNMLHASIPLIHTGDSALGWMEANQWERAQKILLDQKILDKPIQINDAYSMDFLRKIYVR